MCNLGLRDWVWLEKPESGRGLGEDSSATVGPQSCSPVASVVLVMPEELCCLPKPLPGT